MTSYANDELEIDPIVVTSGMSSEDVSDPYSPVVVYAQVSKNCGGGTGG